MLRTIINFCTREKILVLLLTAVVIGFGIYSYDQVPVDAIPDVGENQVIVFTAWPGRSPKDVQDQVTYPLSVALLAVPGAESVRGKSMFGYSFVQVTFKDDVEFYWARSRVSEQLGTAASQLPNGVVPTLGPDATGLGQVYYYTLEPAPGMSLADLRSMQDFVIKYELQAVEGVSEVASVGGYIRQYQIEIDPDKLRFQNIPLDKVIAAIKASNMDVGAKTVESSGMEYIIRGKGFLGSDQDPKKTVTDIEKTVVVSRNGIPVRIRDLGQVQMGPDFRRGAIDLNGSEAVGGVVVMRYGENPRKVIERIKEKIASIEPGLKGVKIKGIYDRTGLIKETIGTLSTALTEEVLITMAVILLFLLHVRASIIVASTLPIAVLMAFTAMNVFGVDANLMSLAGIAIAIGTMVDMGIIVSENIYQHLADWEAKGALGGQEQRLKVIQEAAYEVAPAVMTAVSTTVISFLPVFFLTGRDYKLFAPLAWTKSFSLVASLIVAVLLVPLLSRLLLKESKMPKWLSHSGSFMFGLILAATCYFVWGHRVSAMWDIHLNLLTGMTFLLGAGCGILLSREKLRPIEANPVSRLINWVYEPTLRLFLRYKLAFLMMPTFIFLLGLGAWVGLPTLLKPVENTTKNLGADLNKVPGYVDFKHSFTGLESDDWIALDEGSWFYMPTLYPAVS
ncbi:Cobalt-zinc-cadmium resistance protein CzcA; Cation efflux system protein CusA, partial [hydrothermal vent metagenome]